MNNNNRRDFFNNGRYYNDDCCGNNNTADSCCDDRNNGGYCEPGGALGFADFYALMPPDNAAAVAPGTDVSFPQDGPNSGVDIVRTGPSSFNLAEIGTYQVFFQVAVDEAGQLILTLNEADLAYTVVGR